MKHFTYYLLCILFFSCVEDSDTSDCVSFSQVDPFLKVFRESNFFPERDAFESDVDEALHAYRLGEAVKKARIEQNKPLD